MPLQGLTTDRKLNLARRRWRSERAGAYSLLEGCLQEFPAAVGVLELFDELQWDRLNDQRGLALFVRACVRVDRNLAAARALHDFVLHLAQTSSLDDMQDEVREAIDALAETATPEVRAVLRGKVPAFQPEGHGSPRELFLASFYLNSLLNLGSQCGLRAFARKLGLAAESAQQRQSTGRSTYLRFLKRYSSFTPMMAPRHKDRIGGGYFFNFDSYGVVVDPGHRFLDTFFGENLKLDDINGIVVTHFHDDHYADFPALISLLFQHFKGSNRRHVDLFLDATTSERFAPLIEGWNTTVMRSETGTILPINDTLSLEPLPTQHDIMEHGNTGVGLAFRLEGPAGASTVLVTGDTGWNESLGDCYKSVRRKSASLVLVAHVSSVYEGEVPAILSGGVTVRPYEKHLCLYGLAKAIEASSPETVVLSEIGEELDPWLATLSLLVERTYGVPCLIGQIDSSGDRLGIGH
jgi:phosphoribosyl 1,2-cyclic phosphodiesterase